MKIYRSLDEVPDLRNPAVTIGTFDGVHLGHRSILNTLSEAAREMEGESVLLTFWPHPRMVLQPDTVESAMHLLNTIDEKIALLEKTGIDHLVIIPFSIEFSRMSYLLFIRDILVGKLNVKHLVVGHDHHFGKNREGSFEQLKECAPVYHFKLTQVPALLINGIPVSSSKIRNALLDYELDKANNFLGYQYSIRGTVVRGMGRGKALGYPTANILPEDKYKLIPANGVYAVEVEHGHSHYKGMTSIGYNPTFGDTGKTIEVNILAFNDDIYHEKITLRFARFLRKEAKFASVPELIRQIDDDKQRTLDFFANL